MNKSKPMSLSCVFIVVCTMLLLYAAPALFAMGMHLKGVGKKIRIALTTYSLAHDVEIKVNARHSVIDIENPHVLWRGGKGSTYRLRARNNTLVINGQPLSSRGIKILPSRSPSLSINGRCFKGSLEVRKIKRYGFTLINEVKLKDYLASVVPSEVYSNWPEEALKAQAIVTRTMALYGMTTRRRPYHTTDLEQAYKGISVESRSTQTALTKTAKLVVLYYGRLIPSYFHAICGGHTESAANVWNGTLVLPPSVTCPFCHSASRYHWQARIPLSEVEKCLTQYGHAVGNIASVKPRRLETLPGRVVELMITHSNGTTTIPVNAFRLALGHNKVQSALFRVTVHNGDLVFEGRGWGHGVGLCQEGARKMAESGFRYDQILHFYYPGITLKKVRL